MRASDVRVCLAAALLLAAAGPRAAWAGPQQSAEASAQAQPQAPQAQSQQAQPPATTAAPQKPEQAEPERQRRPSRRTPRTSSRRQPSSGGQGYLDEARAARDAGPTRKELVLSAAVMGGYDDNLTAGLGSGGIGQMAMASGSTANADATLGYFLGNTARSLRMDVTGNVVSYPKYLDGPAAGGSADIGAQTRVGRSVTLRASERVGYEPFFSVFAPPGSGATLPAAGSGLQATELFERRSLSSNTSAGVDTRWSRRNSTMLSYSYGTRRYTDETDYGDSRSHTADARYRLILANSLALNADYRFQDLEYTYADGGARPIRSHRIEGGPDVQKSLSRGRHFSLSLAAGAGYVESFGPADLRTDNAWVPTGRASARYAFSQTWSIDADYRRDFSMLQSVTDDVYTTDTARVNAGGLVTDRAFLGFGASYANWTTPFAAARDATLDVYGASVQLRIAVTRSLAATAGYYYYRHRYSDPGALPAGFPAEFDRNAVRVGFSLWTPLAGTSSQRPLGPR